MHFPSHTIVVYVGLICQGCNVHRVFATDSLWLLPETSCILPIVTGKDKQIRKN